MKRLFRLFLKAFAGLLLFALVVYVGLVHPNDARMGPVRDGPLKPATERLTQVSTLFSSSLSHFVTIDPDRNEDERARLLEGRPNVILRSRRFTSPYQIYLPVGRYPIRLDARDALFVPEGTTLVVKPGLVGPFEARFALMPLDTRARIEVATAKGGVVSNLGLRQKEGAPNTDGKWYRSVGRYLSVDPVDRLDEWDTQRFGVTFQPDDELQITCSDAPLGCAVSDVEFYARSAPTAKNVLVILVDTMRGDALAGGHARRMQRLAEESVVFDQALAGGNMTSPSTNAFLSCRLPSQLGEVAFSYGVSSGDREAYYVARRPSFPARFAKGRYDTAMIGNVSVISEIFGVGIDHGFRRQVSLEVDGYDTPMIAREAVRWLGRNGDHPFFLYLHFNAPHAPYRAPLRDLFATFPGFDVFGSYSKALKWLYQGEIAYTDRYVGEVLDALRDLGLSDSTVVVLTADHGDQHEARVFAPNESAPPFSGAYFDHGATLLNDEIRVPLVFHVPGLAPRRVADYVSTLDTGATLLDYFGLPGARECAGRTLMPYLRGEDPGMLRRRVLGSEGFQGRAIVFDNRYKYVRLYEPTDKRVHGETGWGGERKLYFEPEQLFDLDADPNELKDLLPERQDLLTAARVTYRQLFGIKDAFEVVVENPANKPLDLVVPTAARVEVLEGEADVDRSEAGKVRVTGTGSPRYLVLIHGPLAGIPDVKLGKKHLTVERTALRLPLSTDPKDLPSEVGGRYSLLEKVGNPVAYVRRVEDDGQQNRRISTANAAFEKVLREWGYLNDK